MSMTSQKNIELTIRAAMLIKAVSELIGRNDAFTIRLVIKQIRQELNEIEQFLNKVSKQ